MPENLQRYTKLLVVSDTGMYKKGERTYAFGPVVTELNEMLSIFECITWIGFRRDDQIKNMSYQLVSSTKIKTIALQPVGGPSIIDKYKILVHYPKMWSIINSEVITHDFIHCRAPSNPAYIAMILSKRYANKQFWFKYAGSWVDQTSYFYNLQRRKLKKLNQNSKITVNGHWQNQPKNVIPFENPCLTEDDRSLGKAIICKKKLSGKINYCFVGGLNENKGIRKIIEAFKTINSSKIGIFHIVGEGEMRKLLEEKVKELSNEIVFHGLLSKDKLYEIYKASHFIILPSQSEGFPKVIGEAMNFGCVPIISEVSCINQYIQNNYNGLLINPISIEFIKEALLKSLVLTFEEFENYIAINYKLAEKFTYTYFLKNIKENIFTL